MDSGLKRKGNLVVNRSSPHQYKHLKQKMKRHEMLESRVEDLEKKIQLLQEQLNTKE